jgi:hypothetical protein
LLGEYLSIINHHQGLYSKLAAVEEAYMRTTAATAAGSAPSELQLTQQVTVLLQAPH